MENTNAAFAALAARREAGEPAPGWLLDFLMKLSLLENVPFAYLAPDGLPAESLRFFEVDQNWVFTLLDGALSLGRDLALDRDMDAALIQTAWNSVAAGRHNVRLRLQRKPDAPPAGGGDGAASGCRLRSALGRGWRGLEFKGYANGAEAAALRLETLADEVLLGVFRGRIDRLDILEPPESLHFGVAARDGGCEKMLRRTDTGELDPAHVIPLEVNELQVLSYRAAAQRIQDALGGEVSSADIALHMIQNAFSGVIEREK